MKLLSKEYLIKYDEIIESLGEEKIEQLYFIMGSEKFSVATIKNIIKKRKIISSIKEGIPFQKIASQIGVSKMTIYRYLKDGLKK